jgi:hypothetical protein
VSASWLLDLMHGIVVGGIIAVRYLWPVWLVIILLWGLSRLLRAIFTYFAGPAPRHPPARGRGR